jgi:lipopolysaccharide export system protein LptA
MRRLVVAIALLLAMAFASSPASADVGSNDAPFDISGNLTWE